MTCREALAALAGGTRASGGRAAAERHLASCGTCRVRLDQLSAAILSGRDDEISCAECDSRLATYLSAERAGDAEAAHPHVHQHLAGCPECAATLVALREALALLEAGALPEPDAYPRFDTAFVAGRARPAAQRLGATAAAAAWTRRAFDRARAGGEALREGLLDPPPPDDVPPRRFSSVLSAGALLPVVIVLVAGAFLAWRSMQSAGPEPVPDAPARMTADAARGVRETEAAASATAAHRATDRAGEGANEGPPGIAPARRASSTAAPTGTPSATASATVPPPADDATGGDGDRSSPRPRTPGGPGATAVPTQPEGALETAYPPRLPTRLPATSYPPPAPRETEKWRPPTAAPTTETPVPPPADR